MKRFFTIAALVLAAVCSTSCFFSKEDVIYTIALSTEGSTTYVDQGNSDAKTVYTQFVNELNTFINSHKADFVWTVTVTGGKTSTPDNEAIAKYDSLNSQLGALYSKYQTQLSACSGKLTVERKDVFRVYRFMSSEQILKETPYSIKYNK